MAARIPDVLVLLGDPSLPDPSKPEGRFHEEDLACVARLREALGRLEGPGDYRFSWRDRHEGLLADFAARPPAFVLNFCDTGFRNQVALEPHVPALLDLLDIPYSGSGPGALPVCQDKAAVRGVAASLGVPVPEEEYVRAAETDRRLPRHLPVLIKPNQTDGSLGITQASVVHDSAAARRTLDGLREALPGHDVLFQEYLPGGEYSVGLVGNPGRDLRALPVLEVDFGGLDAGLPPILGYESKTLPDSPYWSQVRFREARLEAAERERLVDTAKLLFARLGLRDYGRVDFRTDARGVIKLLEVNPNPAWGWDGKLALMAGLAGMEYADLVAAILEAAQARVRS